MAPECREHVKNKAQMMCEEQENFYVIFTGAYERFGIYSLWVEKSPYTR